MNSSLQEQTGNFPTECRKINSFILKIKWRQENFVDVLQKLFSMCLLSILMAEIHLHLLIDGKISKYLYYDFPYFPRYLSSIEILHYQWIYIIMQHNFFPYNFQFYAFEYFPLYNYIIYCSNLCHFTTRNSSFHN